MKKDLKKIIIEKGQGLTEYVLILAFIAGVAFMMFGGDGSLKGTLVSTVTKTNKILAGLFGDAKQYKNYFSEWRDTPFSELATKDPAERLKADQMALELIAKAFISKDFEGVKGLMETFTRGENLKKEDKFDPQDGLNGYSEATLVPLSFELVQEEGGSYYTWLQTEENKNLVSQVLANDAQIVSKADSGISRTKVEDGIFYSDGMIGESDNNLRTVNLRLHYTNGTVDSVDITARQGGWNGTVVDGLNLHVTDTGYTPNNKDYVLNPNLARD